MPGRKADAMRKRLEALCQKFSQSEVARRTGVPVSSVNRYLGGARIPAEFCGALVTELGVNPAWMLTGEGAPWLSEVGAGTQQMAGDLMELVEAMNAVERMRIGSLTGRDHLKMLRRLSEALQDYEALKGRLHDQSRPIFERVLNDWRTAMNTDKVEQSNSLRKAARQVARLCEDPALHRLMTRLESQHEMLFGDGESSLHYARRALVSALAMDDFPTEETLEEARRFAIALRYAGRLNESLRYLRAFRILAEHTGRDWRSYRMMDQFEGYLRIELGELGAGMAILRDNLRAISGPPREASESGIAYALFLTGVAGYRALREFGTPGSGRAMTLTEFSVWLEDAESVKDSLSGYEGPYRLDARLARALLDLRANRKRAFAVFMDAIENPAEKRDIHEWVCIAQLAQRCGQRAKAEEATDKADALLMQVPPDVTPSHLRVAQHYRTVLRLGRGGEMAERALAWFRQRAEMGYGLFEPVLAEFR